MRYRIRSAGFHLQSQSTHRQFAFESLRTGLGTRSRRGRQGQSPLCCVASLRYARRASSIRSSESHGLETIVWSSGACQLQGVACRVVDTVIRNSYTTTSPQRSETHHSRTAPAPRHRAPFPPGEISRICEIDGEPPLDRPPLDRPLFCTQPAILLLLHPEVT